MDKISETERAPASRKGLDRSVDRHRLAVELMETAKLALPMVLTQLGQIAMMTTDLAFIGRLGPEAVAAAALANRVYLVSVAFATGLLAVIAPLAAEAFGAGNLGVVRRSLRMGLWAALLISLPIMAFPLRGEQILLAFGQAPHVTRLAQQYLFGLTWGVAPALWFLAIRTFMGAVNRPEPALGITLAAIPVNALLVYLLIHGKLGLPRLELFGAGLATTLVNCATFLAGLWFTTMCRPFRYYHGLAHLWRFDWPMMRQLIVIGMPVSISFLMDAGFFSAAALLMGMISTAALAAHQIAFQVFVILYMIPSGISMAAAVRVGHAVGRSDGPGIKRAGLVAMLLGIVVAAILTVVVIASRFEITALFLGKSADDANATIGLAGNLLLVGALFFITEATHSIALGSLRGLKDTRVPLLFATIGYWLIGFPLSYLLSFKMGPIGIWIGMAIGTTTSTALLVLRFKLLASRLLFRGGI
ncbi:MATE family efflux transporter [Mesorhizobium sp. LjNodule214]|uniref:MATE family efflux transporter n=1 Tax=Mesorhizobium sp. LjNodule214 TaxID=3342252 RepID=UPI003ED029E4